MKRNIDAEIADAGLLPAQEDATGIVVGTLDDAPLVDATMAPVIVMGPCRSGKSSAILVPTLLTWRRSAVVIDVQGELSGITAPWREVVAGNRVRRVRFDGVTPLPDAQALVRELRDSSQPTTVYCTVNPSNLQRVETSLRDFLNAILEAALAGSPREPDDALLVVLDQFAMLGKLAALPQELAELSGKGVKLLMAMRQFDELEAAYQADAEALWKDCVKVLFAPNEYRTASEMAEAVSRGLRSSVRYRAARLTPDEAMTLPRATSWVVGLTARPFRATRRGYFEDAKFANLAAQSA
jgi:type IV secretory pathway TraG/TraD family ATPase VirD4